MSVSPPEGKQTIPAKNRQNRSDFDSQNQVSSPAGIVDAIEKISQRAFQLASFLTIVLVLLTTEQVIARYVFDASSIALQELEWHLFGIILMLSMAYTLKQDGHVRVDFLSDKMRKSTRRRREQIGLTLFILCAGTLIYYGADYALESLTYDNPRPNDYYTTQLLEKENLLYQPLQSIEGLIRRTLLIGEISPDPGGLEARWFVKMLFPLGMLLLLIQSVTLLCRSFSSRESVDGD